MTVSVTSSSFRDLRERLSTELEHAQRVTSDAVRLDTLLDGFRSLRRAAGAASRSVHVVRVGGLVGPLDAGKRDAALAALKRIRALTPDAMWRAAHAKLEASVALAGPYAEQRLRALKTGVDLFRRSPALTAIIKGPLPAARRALKPFPQLGEAGAHRMLLFAADHPILPVDARVSRVGLRLGYGEPGDDFRKTSRAVQSGLTRELPHAVDAFRRAFQYLSHHGAATCTETDPHCQRLSIGVGLSRGQERGRKLQIDDCRLMI